MLGLRDRHPVAGDDHDVVRVGERDRGVLGAHRLVSALLAFSAATAEGAPEAGEEQVGDRAVHRLAHLEGEDRSRGADQGPGDDQHDVVEREAGCGRGQPGEGVQQRDHDRHVGAADREHEEVAEQR